MTFRVADAAPAGVLDARFVDKPAYTRRMTFRVADAAPAGVLDARFVDKPVYSSWPHSVRPLRRLAGGCAPSDPAFPARHGSGERRGAPSLEPRRGGRGPSVAPSWPPAGSLAVTGAGLRIRPWVGPWPTGWLPSGSCSPHHPVEPGNGSHGHSGRFGGRLAESARPWDRL